MVAAVGSLSTEFRQGPRRLTKKIYDYEIWKDLPSEQRDGKDKPVKQRAAVYWPTMTIEELGLHDYFRENDGGLRGAEKEMGF